MFRFRRGTYKTLDRNKGSMPIALFITVMFLVLSVGIISLVATQITQNRAEDNARIANWGLGSAIAVVSEKIGPSARVLTNLSTTEPSTWTSLSATNNNTFYRWWISSSSNAILNTSTLPSGAWSGVTYGNNIWVAVNTAGTSFTSPDGINWTQRNNLPNAGTLLYTNITYGLGKFIATADASATNIATSPDGITWTSVTVAAGTYIPSCSTATCILLSTTSATGYYTGNLTSFTLIPTVPLTTKAIVFAVSTFTAVGNNAVATSPNGVNWTTRTATNRNWGLVGAVNGILVAAEVQTTGSTNIIVSTNSGVSWTDNTLPNTGNWIALTTAGPQLGLFSGPISGTNQSTYLASSNGLTWVNNSLSASANWIGAKSNYKSFLVYPAANPAYLIPITAGVSPAQELTISTRVQTGRVTASNEGQYLASMTFNWNVASKRWTSSKYLGSTASSLTVAPSAPLGATAARTAPGTIVVSWIPPTNTGSSAISSYAATSSPGGYNCPNGGRLNGTICTITTTSAATLNAGYYSCPSGGVLSGTTCTLTTTYAANYTASFYSCPSGGTLSGTTCTRTYAALYNGTSFQCNTGDTPTGLQVSAVTCTRTYAANYTAATYQCNTGDTPTGVQSSAVACTRTYAATYNPPVYSCPSGGTLSGTTCTVSGSYAATYNPETYSCPSGGTLSGTTCTISGSYAATANTSTSYSCPSGGTLSGTTCTINSSYAATWVAGTASYYTCPSGGTLSGTTCIVSTSYAANWQGGYYYCHLGGTLRPDGISCYNRDLNPTVYAAAWQPGYYWCPNGDTLSGSTCTGSSSYAATLVAGTASYYTCPSGGTLSGATCITQSSYAATANITTTYSCPSGGTLSGTTCNTTSTYAATLVTAAYYSCPSGGTLSGTTCTLVYSAPLLVAAYYSCTSGGTPSGTSPTTFTCTNTYTSPGAAAYYYCTSGDTPTGTSPSTFTCTNTYTATLTAAYYSCTSGDTPTTTSSTTFTCTNIVTYVATNNPAVYTCASGGSLSGNLCLTQVPYNATYNAGGYTCVSSSATNCTITGMANGAYTFSVIATNGSGASISSVASNLVQPNLITINYPSTVFSTTQLSQVVTPVVTGSSGATLSYAVSGTLPAGVTFDTSTGAITGRSSWAVLTGFPLSISVTATDSLTGISVVAPFTFTLITP